ncbi:MAG: hypothetical protein M1114_06430, partial [Candidatus Dependentiae bacterium]|nr:hypothetical protein [Candidatus Dependentiae bacterium]
VSWETITDDMANVVFERKNGARKVGNNDLIERLVTEVSALSAKDRTAEEYRKKLKALVNLSCTKKIVFTENAEIYDKPIQQKLENVYDYDNEAEEAASDDDSDEQLTDESDDTSTTASTSTDGDSSDSSRSSSPIDFIPLQKLEHAPESFVKKSKQNNSLTKEQEVHINLLQDKLSLLREQRKRYLKDKRVYIKKRQRVYFSLPVKNNANEGQVPLLKNIESIFRLDEEIIELQGEINKIKAEIEGVKNGTIQPMPIELVQQIGQVIASNLKPQKATSSREASQPAEDGVKDRHAQMPAMKAGRPNGNIHSRSNERNAIARGFLTKKKAQHENAQVHVAKSSSATSSCKPASLPVYVEKNIAADPLIAAYLRSLDIEASLNKKFAGYINKGDYVLWALCNGQRPAFTDNGREFYLQNIIRLIWRFYAHALQKKQGFEEGTFYLPTEASQKIFDYLRGYVELVKDEKTSGVSGVTPGLSGNPFAYPRISSHYTHSEPEQYGIDIRFNAQEDVKTLLPEGKTHILFGRNFIKIENHGLATINDFAGHTGEFFFAQGRKLMPAIFGSDDQEGYRKERVPRDELNLFKQLLADLQVSGKECEGYYENAKKHGIQDMYRIARALHSNYAGQENLTIRIDEYLKRLETDYSYLEQRMGKEVMLGDSLFKPQTQNMSEQASSSSI